MQSLQSPHQKMQSFQIFNACAQTASCCCKVLIAQPAPFKFLCLLLLLQLQATKQHVVFCHDFFDRWPFADISEKMANNCISFKLPFTWEVSHWHDTTTFCLQKDMRVLGFKKTHCWATWRGAKPFFWQWTSLLCLVIPNRRQQIWLKITDLIELIDTWV